MQFHPFACVHNLPDAAMMRRSIDAMLSFGAPVSLILEEIDNKGMLDTTVEERGIMFLAAEIGGTGGATAKTVSIAQEGVLNVLAHLGVLAPRPPAPETVLMETTSPGSYIHANHSGLFELLADLGDEVRSGQALARIHSIERPDEEPVTYTASRDGVLIGRHHPGLIRQGDFLALIGGPHSI